MIVLLVGVKAKESERTPLIAALTPASTSCRNTEASTLVAGQLGLVHVLGLRGTPRGNLRMASEIVLRVQ